MRFVTFRRLGDATSRLGIDNDDDATLIDLTGLHPERECCVSLRALIDAGALGLDLARKAYDAPPAASIVNVHDVVLVPPLEPSALRDTGVIRTHLRPYRVALSRWIHANTDDERTFEELVEWGVGHTPASTQPRYADRDAQQILAPNAVLHRPSTSTLLDYELEFAVVTARRGRNIDPADAYDYIFGYTIYNDWSLRDVQAISLLTGSGLHGDAKNFPGSNSIGPCVVTKDEIPDPYNLSMSVRVNGETWGSGSTAQAWCTFEDAIVAVSSQTDIQSGEVWGSGTSRDGCAFEIGRQLPNHAFVELEIEKIGVLANYVVPGD